MSVLPRAESIKGVYKIENTPLTEEELNEHARDILSDPRRVKYVEAITNAIEVLPSREHHFDTMKHEIEQYKENISLEKIKVPTLVAHGTLDGDVPYTQAQ